eukprot:Hpha_TRINITY_DN2348_c0_g1::TRINITY_DN2348_c0_g1_i1::g.459::m.459
MMMGERIESADDMAFHMQRGRPTLPQVGGQITCQSVFQDPYTLREDLFEHFLAGTAVESVASMRMNNKSTLARAMLKVTLPMEHELRMLREDTTDHYRTFHYLLHYLQRPWFMMRCCPLPLPLDVRRRLVLKFFRLDNEVCRETFGMSSKRLKEYRPQQSQRFQVENLRNVFKYVTRALALRDTPIQHIPTEVAMALSPKGTTSLAGFALGNVSSPSRRSSGGLAGRRLSVGDEMDDLRSSRRGSEVRPDAHGLPRIPQQVSVTAYIRSAFHLAPCGGITTSSTQSVSELRPEASFCAADHAELAETYAVLCFSCRWGIETKKKRGGVPWGWEQLFSATRLVMQKWVTPFGLELDPRLPNHLKSVRSVLRDGSNMDIFAEQVCQTLQRARQRPRDVTPKLVKAVKNALVTVTDIGSSLGTKLSTLFCVLRDLNDSFQASDAATLSPGSSELTLPAVLDAAGKTPVPRGKKPLAIKNQIDSDSLSQYWIVYASVLSSLAHILSSRGTTGSTFVGGHALDPAGPAGVPSTPRTADPRADASLGLGSSHSQHR